ncbi:MAG: alanine racemase [Acidobacteria bacterium]|nr:MAG: alanine racemase [Acidobacteriota bacterium]
MTETANAKTRTSGSWVEVSLRRIVNNVAAIRQRIGEKCGIIAVVKADAYGHGAGPVARCLRSSGITSFATATIEEAIEVRQAVNDSSILVLTGCDSGQEPGFRQHDLTASVFEKGRVPDAKIELKVDSGMGRLGVALSDAPALLADLDNRLVGVYSQFASSDGDDDFTRTQLRAFLAATRLAKCRRHIANSAGLRFPDAHLDAVRPGLALYGIAPCPAVSDIQPALSWKTRVLSLRSLSPGQSVGYGRTFLVSRPSLIAVLPVGYADGYSRAFSNKGQVRIRGRLAPVVGRVSMDLISVDVTGVPGVSHGDEVTLLEADPDSPISARALARAIDTIPYEIVTSIGRRVERVYLKR